MFAGLLSRIDAIGESGLDGHELRELGLKNGNLTVNDERTGKRWTFRDISLSVDARGAAASRSPSARTMPNGRGGSRFDRADRQRLPQDRSRSAPRRRRAISFWPRASATETRSSMCRSRRALPPWSGPTACRRLLSGRVVADAGSIGDTNDEDGRLRFDHAEFRLNWNAASRVLTMPFQILSGGNRITLMGQIEAPEEGAGTIWPFKVGGGGTVCPHLPQRAGRAADPQPHRRERALRCGQAPLRHRRG